MKNDKGQQRPIIVMKKRKGHHGHHGGSWKVAYADFVTAMMAFFMVMWIMGMDTRTKDIVQGYFSNPVGFRKSYSGGQNPLSSGNAPSNVALKRLAMLTREFERERFEAVQVALRQMLAENEELRELRGQIEIVLTPEGLRIELLERETGETLFAFGSAEPRPVVTRLLTLIAERLSGLPNAVVIEGHTDAAPYGSARYSNWELSVDRANAARRTLVAGGLEPARIAGVRGYAATQLRLPSNPLHPSNRRVTLLLPYMSDSDAMTLPRAVTSDEKTAAAAVETKSGDAEPAS